jgi:hypothetical protein
MRLANDNEPHNSLAAQHDFLRLPVAAYGQTREAGVERRSMNPIIGNYRNGLESGSRPSIGGYLRFSPNGAAGVCITHGGPQRFQDVLFQRVDAAATAQASVALTEK